MSSKLREALSDACYAMFNFLKTQNGGYEEMAIALDKAKATLAKHPLRNCDVGTAEEQEQRFIALCNKQHDDCFMCPVQNNIKAQCDCKFVWSQMPYEKEGER
jgi:hypothetical protein